MAPAVPAPGDPEAYPLQTQRMYLSHVVTHQVDYSQQKLTNHLLLRCEKNSVRLHACVQPPYLLLQ
uniref:Uncharacterized protein n=1 Tax=Peronospora matthiolae TaxID=2874970 RepID=A0AAV1VNY3_9STRA